MFKLRTLALAAVIGFGAWALAAVIGLGALAIASNGLTAGPNAQTVAAPQVDTVDLNLPVEPVPAI